MAQTVVPEYNLGFDYGNSETSGWSIDKRGKNFRRKMPSMLALGNLHDLANKRSARGEDYDSPIDALAEDECVLKYEGSEYFVGELALRESRSASTGRNDISRYWSTRSLVTLLALSGRLIDQEEYALHLVTGLPVETFDKEPRAKVARALDGRHVFSLNGRRRVAHVRVAKVIMEGAGALIAHGENTPVLQGVIDIGGRTTDLYTAHGQKTVTESCKGKPQGVEVVGDILNTYFGTHYRRTLKPEEVRDVLRAYSEHKSFPALVGNGKDVDNGLLRSWVETAIGSVAQEILSFVSSSWNTTESGMVAGDMKPVLLVGGGAYYFAPYIRERIEHLVVPENPEFANAEGYAHLAKASQELNTKSAASA